MKEILIKIQSKKLVVTFGTSDIEGLEVFALIENTQTRFKLGSLQLKKCNSICFVMTWKTNKNLHRG
ncbi:MAG: hypothetical protein ACK41T_07560 [Pseudobdellovibrio sp.]